MNEDNEILRPLVDELLAVAAEPRQQFKKRMWAEHQALRRTEKIPVCVYYEGIPHTQWRHMLGDIRANEFHSPVAGGIAWDLRRRLWIARNVPDDHISWPTVTVPAKLSRPVSWGVSFGLSGSDNVEDARRFTPAFPDRIDVGKLDFTDQEVDQAATALAVEQARELLEDRMPVRVGYPDLGCSPFDVAAHMRGLEDLMFDVVDDPGRVHALMEYVTSAFEAHHCRRRENGWINCFSDEGERYGEFGRRVHCAYLAGGFDPAAPKLNDEWAYVSAQTSSGLGPEMYKRLVHPYNQRLARLFTNETVYYHGCECLDQKLGVLATLANLRRFHVSPWSSVAAAAEKFAGKVILEVHAHPGRVFFGMTRDEMKADLRALVSQAQGAPLDLNLSDIHSINGNPSLLTAWAQAAQEVALG